MCILFPFLFSVLEIEPRALYILGKCFAMELHSQPFFLLYFEIGPCKVAQAGFELAPLLP
jgi:hypothetical protein